MHENVNLGSYWGAPFMFSQIVFIKSEQNHRSSSTFINNDYTNAKKIIQNHIMMTSISKHRAGKKMKN